MAKRKILTAEEVEQEIERLNQTEAVALARRKYRLEYRRRTYLSQLRFYEKEGLAMMEAGITREKLDQMYAATGDYLPCYTELEGENEDLFGPAAKKREF